MPISSQRGQALVESIIGLSFVVIPLLIMMPFLSKITGAQHRAAQAAHYSTWERTVWKERNPDQMPSRSGLYVAKRSETELMKHIPWRFYQTDGQQITTRYQDKWDWQQNVHPLLKHQMEPDTRQATILKSTQEEPNDQNELDRLTASNRGGDTPGLYGKSVEKAVDLISYTGFDLELDQYYRASVSTDLENLYLAPFDNLNLNIKGQSALLASGWNAAGPHHVKNRVRRLVLTNYMDVGVIRTAQRLVGIIPFGKELKPNRLKLGFVKPDVLPNNRLCTYGTKNCGG